MLSSVLVLLALGCSSLDAASIPDINASNIISNPAAYEPAELRQVIGDQRQAIMRSYRSGEDLDKLIDHVNSLLATMEGSRSQDKDYLKFEAFLMNISSRIQGELGNFGEALIVANNLVKFSETKLDQEDVELARYILDTMGQGLRESFEDLRAELRGSKGTADVKRAYERLTGLIPSYHLELMDQKSVEDIRQMRREAKAELDLVAGQ